MKRVRRALGAGRRNPRLVARALNGAWHAARTGPSYPGLSAFVEDWDNLVILDACRYDLFAEVAAPDLPGELSRVRSCGTNTVQFLDANLADARHFDAVYVTANPQFRNRRDSLGPTFHAVDDLWAEGWDERVNTVLPSVTADRARRAADDHADKRLVIHFNQPHVPFVGDEGRDLLDLDAVADHPLPFWQQAMAGVWDVADEELRRAYRENLAVALPHVAELIQDLDGRTVVTSDHGNMIGERAHPIPVREYGHPRGIYTAELLDVPWLVVPGERRDVAAEPPEDRGDGGLDGDVEARLEDLGYR